MRNKGEQYAIHVGKAITTFPDSRNTAQHVNWETTTLQE